MYVCCICNGFQKLCYGDCGWKLLSIDIKVMFCFFCRSCTGIGLCWWRTSTRWPWSISRMRIATLLDSAMKDSSKWTTHSLSMSLENTWAARMLSPLSPPSTATPWSQRAGESAWHKWCMFPHHLVGRCSSFRNVSLFHYNFCFLCNLICVMWSRMNICFWQTWVALGFMATSAVMSYDCSKT